MRIYRLSQVGSKIAKNVSAPDSANWRVIYTLDKIGYGTADQIALQSGLDDNEAVNALGTLKRKGIVEER